MRYILLLILFSNCGTYKYSSNKNLEKEIITFLFEKKQITQKQKNKIKNNFDGYITIESLQQKKFDKKDGIYIFSVNSSHNYKYFLLIKLSNFKILNINDDFEKINKKISDYGLVLTDLESDAIRNIIVENNTVKERYYIKKIN